MTDEEIQAELERRLREHVDHDLVRDGDVFFLHLWEGQPQQPPLQLHAPADQLGRYCRLDADTRDALWPSSPVEVAGLNLLLVHLDEALSLALDTAPSRRHIILEPHLMVLTDPTVVDEEPPASPAMPDFPAGDAQWVAYAPLSGQTMPQEGPSNEPARE